MLTGFLALVGVAFLFWLQRRQGAALDDVRDSLRRQELDSLALRRELQELRERRDFVVGQESESSERPAEDAAALHATTPNTDEAMVPVVPVPTVPTPAAPTPAAQVAGASNVDGASPATADSPPPVPESSSVEPTASTFERGADETPDQRPEWLDEIWSPIENGANWLRNFLTTGNLVAKVGVVVLFFGVAFLLRFAAEQGFFPIEARLLASAAAAIALLLIGWWQRQRRGSYGLTLQGGGVGLFYLTVFAASRLYGVLELGLGLGLLLLITALGSALAVLQSSQGLAVLSVTGGFLAPVLLSTDSGNHVALFSYYAVLNLGIFGVAWFRSWRFLNWVGFAFTFVIGTAWGVSSYQPDQFATTEPFLVLFFVLFVAIGAIYAMRQPPKLLGLIDGSLVFGTPLVALTLQAGLVRDYEFGLAFSALAAAAVYVGLTWFFWSRGAELRALAESYLSLGLGFATLAIPFALDNQLWTASAWALEGAALVWVGLRQSRLLPRLAGVALQVVASLIFLVSGVELAERGEWNSERLLDGQFWSLLLLGVAGLLTSFFYRQAFRATESAAEPMEARGRFDAKDLWLGRVFLLWGQFWLVVCVAANLHDLVPSWLWSTNLILAFSVTMGLESVIARRLGWSGLLRVSQILFPAVLVLALGDLTERSGDSPWTEGGWLAWPAFLLAAWSILRPGGLSERGPEPVRRLDVSWAHALAFNLTVFLATWTVYAPVSDWVSRQEGRVAEDWWFALLAVVPMAILLLVRSQIQRESGAVRGFVAPYERSYIGWGSAPIHVVLASLVFGGLFAEGDSSPLPFVPLANPLELSQLFVAFGWLLLASRAGVPRRGVREALSLVVLAGLTAALARAFHHYRGVPYDLDSLFADAGFQAGLTVLWTVLSLLAMTIAARTGSRRVWIGGALLLSVVVLKLFLVDLSGVGTIARIVSFLTVGVLMLLVGYFSPLPPKREELEAPRERDSGDGHSADGHSADGGSADVDPSAGDLQERGTREGDTEAGGSAEKEPAPDNPTEEGSSR